MEPLLSDIKFAVSSWHEQDELINKQKEYIIYMFGRKEDGKSVTIKITDYKPNFYIKVPSDWKIEECTKAIEHFKQLCPKYSNNITSKIKKYYDLHHNFCAGEKFKFIKFEFPTMLAWSEFSRIFDKKIKIPKLMNDYEKFETYEKKLQPFIVFTHEQDINSAGWNIINVNNENPSLIHQNPDELVTTDQFIITNYKNITRLNEDKALPPFIISSYDIECTSGDGTFPLAERIDDKIISICVTTNLYGSENIIRRDVLCLNNTDDISNANVKEFSNQKDLIIALKDLLLEIDVDFIIGFNTFGFDNKFVYDKATQPEVNCANRFSYISKLKNYKCTFKKENISSAGLGDNEMWLFKIPGIEQFDIMKLIQQDSKLTEYSLNKCAEYFMKRKVQTELIDNNYKIICDTNEVDINNYVKFEVNGFIIEKKKKIIDKGEKYVIIDNSSDSITLSETCYMCLAKDDMGPQEIFDSFPKGPSERKLIHQYCLQDCILVNKLNHRLDFITQRMALASVSHVPISYIILRGQGIKSLSLFAKECKKYSYLIRDLKPDNETAKNGGKMGFEGALVLDPIKAFYERPLTTLDFNSLYPNIERSFDMSHENLVLDSKYLGLDNYHYRTIEFRKVVNKIITDEMITVTFATAKENVDLASGNQKPNKYGILGTILSKLLDERKIAKKNMKKFPAKKQVYSGQEKALKVTANSIYGQVGSGVSPIGCILIAAATTAGGRMLLMRAKDHMETEFKNIITSLYTAWKNNDIEMVNAIIEDEVDPIVLKEFLDDEKIDFVQFIKETLFELFEEHDIFPIVAYGDTDSNFNDFKITHKETGKMPTDRWCRIMCMKLGKIESGLLRKRMPYPNNMAYEKVIHPMALMAKKNYLGHKYEDDPDSYSVLIMGFKLKRRDGSVVFQKVVGSSIYKALNEINPHGALEYLKQELKDIIYGKYNIHDFITTSLLRAKYKGTKLTNDDTGKVGDEGSWFWWDVDCSIKHVKLCQRIKNRDSGNTPSMNTRIPYAYVVKEDSKKLLQCDLIEHPDYIVKDNLKIDYLFYITNQIRNPATQFFELITDNINEIFDNIIKEGIILNEEFLNTVGKKNLIKKYSPYGIKFNADIEKDDDVEKEDNLDKFISKYSNVDVTDKKPKRKQNIIKVKNVSSSIIKNAIIFNVEI